MTREEAIRMLSNRDMHGVPCGYTSGYQEAFDMAIEALQAEPVKHGEWIERSFMHSRENYDREFKCSECGRIVWTSNINYCPNCGAKMDKD